MAQLRQAITEALAIRADAGLKVRQPLGSLTFVHSPTLAAEHIDFFKATLREEINVKQVTLEPATANQTAVSLDLKLTPELKREGLAREIIRHVQSLRKESNFNVDDRIELSVKRARIRKLRPYSQTKPSKSKYTWKF